MANTVIYQSPAPKNIFCYTPGNIERVSFSRVLTTYYAIINLEHHGMNQSEMAKALRWFEVN